MRDYEFTVADVARVLGPRRTIERRLESGERLSLDESERLARLLNMLDLGMQVFKDRAWLKEWLSKPKPVLGQRIPLDLMRTEAGGRMLEDELLQLKHGFFA
jgi:putative toxin-antitoxin system antitoxin component (TIGR02293 family)